MSKNITESTWTDPDDAPPADRSWFEQADHYRGDKLVKRGRPKSDNPKQLVSLRLDPDVIERYRNGGPGWQSRMNETLRNAAWQQQGIFVASAGQGAGASAEMLAA